MHIDIQDAQYRPAMRQLATWDILRAFIEVFVADLRFSLSLMWYLGTVRPWGGKAIARLLDVNPLWANLQKVINGIYIEIAWRWTDSGNLCIWYICTILPRGVITVCWCKPAVTKSNMIWWLDVVLWLLDLDPLVFFNETMSAAYRLWPTAVSAAPLVVV